MSVRCPEMGTTGGLYAAYGPSMDPELMLDRCPHSPFAGTGWVPGWRLTFGGWHRGLGSPIATVVQDPSSTVFVALYELAPSDHEELDRWEAADTGLSAKIRLRVSTLDGEVVPFVYVLTDYEGGLPTARYLAMLSDAAEKAGAPETYVAELRGRPCLSQE